MPRLAIYHDANSGNHAMRVTKDVADAPWAVAITDYGKMHFDSLNPNQVFPEQLLDLTLAYFGSMPVTGVTPQNWPSGAADAAALGRFMRINPSTTFAYFAWAWSRISQWTTPRHVKGLRKRGDGWIETSQTYDFVQFINGEYIHGSVATVTSTVGYAPIWYNAAFSGSIGGIATTSGPGAGIPGYGGWYLGTFIPVSGAYDQKIVTWPMPALDEAFVPAGQAVTPNKTFAQLSNQSVRIARPGFDVETASPGQLLLSSETSPLLVVKTGVVPVAAGQTVNVPLPDGVLYDEDMLVDVVITKAGQADTYYPVSFEGDVAYGNWFGGLVTKVLVGAGGAASFLSMKSEASIALTVRYMVFRFAGGGSGGTGGTLVKTEADRIQILRPGAATPPAVDDVLFDTRFPYCPIIAEGHWSVPNIGNAGLPQAPQVMTVNFANTGGWVPYPVWMTRNQYDKVCGPMADVMAGRDETGAYSPWHNRFSSRTTRAKITDTSVTFEAYSTHPTDTYRENDANNIWRIRANYGLDRVVSLRYYIFAIPV